MTTRPDDQLYVATRDGRRGFLVQGRGCDNPACRCMTLRFQEQTTEAPGSPFTVVVSQDTWLESTPRERCAAEAEALRAALAAMTDEVRAQLRSWAEARRLRLARLASYRIPAALMKDGILVPYTTVVTEEGSILDRPDGGCASFSLTHGGRDYIIEDTYCVNPRCHCRDVVLQALELAGDDARRVATWAFAAKVPPKGGPVVDRPEIPEARARAVLDALFAQYDGLHALLRSRFDEIRAVGERSYPTTPRAPIPLPPPPGAGGPARNGPCPCGSGRKYKRCCGV